MSVRRIIFLSVFGLFQLGLLIFTLAVQYKSGFVYTLFNKVFYFKYVAGLGVIFFIIELIWVIRQRKVNRKK